MQKSKKERAEQRATTCDADVLAAITKESQFEKAEFRRVKAAWGKKTAEIQEKINEMDSETESLKRLRAEMSDRLQDWIF